MSLDLNLDKILIIDFGSQFTQLIVRRIRELGVFSELISHNKIKSSQIKSNVKGILLSLGLPKETPFTPLNLTSLTVMQEVNDKIEKIKSRPQKRLINYLTTF